MPELPEVEVVRRGLVPRVLGRTIEDVEILEPRSVRRHAGGPTDLVDQLRGARVSALVRRGKFLWWRLEEPGTQVGGGTSPERASSADLGVALMTHLGMSGQLRVRDAEGTSVDAEDAGRPIGALSDSAVIAESSGPRPDPLRHRRITLSLDDGTRIDFVDQRIFGGLWTSPLVPAGDGEVAGEGGTDDLLPSDAAHIARDLLDPALDRELLISRLRARRAPIKSLLLNQEMVSGIGNIYVDEGLWGARVRYDTPAQRISRVRLGELLDSTAIVMRRALEVGGTSFDALYVNVDGRSGYFARSLAVYGQTGHPCPRCGTLIVRESFTNRSSHFCPVCQRRR